MKKLYTFALAAAVALTASAQTTLTQGTVATKASINELEGIAKKDLTVKNNNGTFKKIAEAAPLADDETWEDLGVAQFGDGWYMTRYGLSATTFKWPVKVQKSSKGEIYKFIDPYHSDVIKQLLASANKDFPFTNDSYDIIIDCTNPNFVSVNYATAFKVRGDVANGLGVTVDTEVKVNSLADYFKANGYSEALITNAGYNNTFAGGVINISTALFGFGNMAVTDAEYGFGDDTPTIIMLPGSSDYSLTVETEGCVTKASLNFVVEAGADIATVKYYAMGGGLYGNTDANFDYLESMNAFRALPQTNGAWSLTFTDPTDGDEATLFVAGYDAEGKRVAKAVDYYVVNLDNADDWKLLGKADFTEDMIGNLYTTSSVAWGTTTYKVDVEENINTPGLYRLVNPYTTSEWPHSSKSNSHNDGHNHYLMIDATNPDKVVIPKSYIGFDGGYGHEYLVSINLYEETDNAALYGKLANGTITMPAASVYDASLLDPDTYKVGTGAFKVVLPALDAVEGIEADGVEAAVEYFNMQGVRVANPAAGQLVIRKQGNTVSKVLVK